MGAVGTACMVLLVAAALIQVGLIVASKHQAQAAADLAALAGSAAALSGEDGCATARRVAKRNGAALESCRTDLAVVTVRTITAGKLVWGTPFRARADARGAPDFYVSRSSKSSN